MKLTKGNKYRFKHQSNVILFLCKDGNWNQFELEGKPNEIWCELLDSDLHLIEEV